MKHPAIQIKQNKTGEFYFTIIAANNKTLATSESYASKQMAQKGALSVVKHINEPSVFAQGEKSYPPRSRVAIRLTKLKALGIETMADVANALNDGRLEVQEVEVPDDE